MMAENNHIFEFLKKCGFDRNSNIFEIGSHMGFDTERIRNIFPESNIYCFEPDSRNIKILEERKIFDIAKIYKYAVTDKNGKSYLNLSSGIIPKSTGNNYYDSNLWSASNSIRDPKDHLNNFPWCTFEEKEEVETITLDSFCFENNIEKIDFIWMDVQGCEDLVFKGGERVLKNTQYIFTEYSNEELYEGQKNLRELIKMLPGEWSIRNDYGGDVLLENLSYRESLIKDTGAWSIKNMNEHVFDDKLAFFILSFFKKKGLKDCIDLGCGPGEYVKYFIKNGISSIRGYDGNINTPFLSDGLCEVQDLTEDFNVGTSDLVLCLEVGEHVPEKYEDILIENITKHVNKYLIISWGIPGQGGYGHVNCRDNIYIINKMKERGLKHVKKYTNLLRKHSSTTWFNNTLMMFKK